IGSAARRLASVWARDPSWGAMKLMPGDAGTRGARDAPAVANRRLRALSSGLAVAIVLAAGSLATVSSVVTATPAVADPCVTGGTPSGQPYTVPATGVSVVQVTVRGQAGQSWFWNGNPSADDSTFLNFETPGGLGSEMTVIIPVTPGQV